MTGRCYARGCDNNNPDHTCMYGDVRKMQCQVNCYNCVHNCKRTKGDIACESFVNAKREGGTNE